MKIKKRMQILLAGMVLGAGTGLVMAEDYSAYSNEEMLQKRSEVRNMSEADRNAFRAEMQKRMQSMSEEERAQMRQGGGQGRGRMDGSGSGGGRGMGMGR